MLTENRGVKQEVAGRRRWFEDDELELIVWYAPSGGVEGFQICEERRDGMHAFTWRRNRGWTHGRVDAGDATPFKNLTPVLQTEGRARRGDLSRVFRARSANLELSLRELILRELEDGTGM